eukprot:12365983-Prorocentrum_lima.AAC.1
MKAASAWILPVEVRAECLSVECWEVSRVLTSLVFPCAGYFACTAQANLTSVAQWDLRHGGRNYVASRL